MDPFASLSFRSESDVANAGQQSRVRPPQAPRRQRVEMASNTGAGGRGRKSTSFMRQLVQLISDHPDVISFDENGILCIPSPPDLEKLLPNYYRTAKLASFQRQLNNFGYHRVGWTPARGQAQPQGLKYHKVVGEATTRTESLLELRPLSRRKRERAPAPAPRRRNARAEPLKRARTESDANAAMLLLSCMRREDSLPALGEPIAA